MMPQRCELGDRAGTLALLCLRLGELEGFMLLWRAEQVLHNEQQYPTASTVTPEDTARVVTELAAIRRVVQQELRKAWKN